MKIKKIVVFKFDKVAMCVLKIDAPDMIVNGELQAAQANVVLDAAKAEPWLKKAFPGVRIQVAEVGGNQMPRVH